MVAVGFHLVAVEMSEKKKQIISLRQYLVGEVSVVEGLGVENGIISPYTVGEEMNRKIVPLGFFL